MASVGSSLAGYFGVFHRLMASRLKEVPTAGAARLAAIVGELADSCGGAEHSFTHAVQLLTHLGAHKHGAGLTLHCARRASSVAQCMLLLVTRCLSVFDTAVLASVDDIYCEQSSNLPLLL